MSFNITSYTDRNKFIRLNTIKNFDKFINMFKRMSPYSCKDCKNALYKSNTGKTYTSSGEVLNFVEIVQAEMFINRVKKHFPTGWIIWRNIDDYEKLDNRIIYIYDYDYCNKECSSFQTLVIKYTDIYNNFGKIFVNVDMLHRIVFKCMLPDEIKVCKDFASILNQHPEPIYKMMEMKQEYKDDYNVYLSDCKKYGFTPLEKCLIERVNINYLGVPTTFMQDATLGWKPDQDCIIVNK